jgi:hypothetical protein
MLRGWDVALYYEVKEEEPIYLRRRRAFRTGSIQIIAIENTEQNRSRKFKRLESCVVI